MSEDGMDKIHMSQAKQAEINSLPVEDTVWHLGLSQEIDAEDNEDHQQAVTVTDRSGETLGYSSVSEEGMTLSETCRLALCVSALYPLHGVARRPRHIVLSQQLASMGTDLCLADLGIQTGSSKGKENISSGDRSLLRMRECCVCRKKGSRALFTTCEGCQTMLYCGPSCQKEDWSRTGDMEAHSHKVWCSRMKAFMDLSPKLAQHPFSFASECALPEFVYETFLQSCGVYNEGAWCRETDFYNSVPFGELGDYDDAVVLPVESTVLDEPPSSPAEDKVHDWESYFMYRGLQLESPVAIILQWPLTLHYIINHCLKLDYDSIREDEERPCPFLIDIIGVEKEVDMLPVFKELGHLNPTLTLDVYMYGVEVSKKAEGKIYNHNNITITVIRGQYHQQALTGRVPNLAVGLNAGLGAYSQWKDTLVKIMDLRCPAYFTDYCLYSYQCSRIAVESLKATLSDPIINPYRSPIRNLAEEHDMPWYSNAFMFHLSYS